MVSQTFRESGNTVEHWQARSNAHTTSTEPRETTRISTHRSTISRGPRGRSVRDLVVLTPLHLEILLSDSRFHSNHGPERRRTRCIARFMRSELLLMARLIWIRRPAVC